MTDLSSLSGEQLRKEAARYRKWLKSLRRLSVEVAMRSVEILGSGCASAHALSELQRRHEAGEAVALYHVGSTIVVGPTEEAAEARLAALESEQIRRRK